MMKRGEQSVKRKGPFATHCGHWRCLTDQGPGSPRGMTSGCWTD